MPQKKLSKPQHSVTILVGLIISIGLFFSLLWNRQEKINHRVTTVDEALLLDDSSDSPTGIDKVRASYSMDYILSKTSTFKPSKPEEISQYLFVAEAMESGQVFRFRVPLKNHLQPAHNVVKYEYANFIGKDYIVRVLHNPGQDCAQLLTEDSLIPYIQAYFKSGKVRNVKTLKVEGLVQAKSWEMPENEKHIFGYIGCYSDTSNRLWRLEMLFDSAITKEESNRRAVDILNSFEFSKK